MAKKSKANAPAKGLATENTATETTVAATDTAVPNAGAETVLQPESTLSPPVNTEGPGTNAPATPVADASATGTNTQEDSQPVTSVTVPPSGEVTTASASSGATASAPGSDPVPQEEAKAYAVCSPLKHNGERYGPGTKKPTIFMTETEAKALVEIGVLADPQE